MAQVTNFFVGANSGEGFRNLFSELVDLEDTYDLMVLKGGPGVGKNTFMREIGRTMEEAGAAVEYLWCSGDPDSLDGVVIPELRCAVADGTPPHAIEPQYPAAVDRYVDLGRFYDLTAAKASAEEEARAVADLRLREFVTKIRTGEAVDSMELLDCLSRVGEDNWASLGLGMFGLEDGWWPSLLTALENVMLPMEFKKIRKKEAADRAAQLLLRVGLTERIFRQFPKMMSGGEQQRVAIARAVAAGGEIILADEPTGNLDSENEQKIVELLKELAHKDGYTVIVITHNQKVAEETDHVFRMSDGRMEQVR